MRPRRLLVFGWLAVIGLLAPGAAGQELQEGDIVVTDRGTGAVIRIDPATGDQTVLKSGFPHPRGILADSFGSLFLTESGGNFVLHLDPDTGQVGRVAGPSGFTVPADILFDQSGELLVAEAYASIQTFPLGPAVLRLDPVVGEPEAVYAEFLNAAGDFTLGFPEGLALDPDSQTLYISDTATPGPVYNPGVYKIDLSKPYTKSTVEPVSLNGDFQIPKDVALEPERDGKRTLLVADRLAGTVFRVDPNVLYNPVYPQANQVPVVWDLDEPIGLYVYQEDGEFNDAGDFLVALRGAGEVRRYDKDGGGPHDTYSGGLVTPWRITVMGQRTSRANFLVADTDAQALYQLTPDPADPLAATRGAVGHVLDFETPAGIAVETEGTFLDRTVLLCDGGSEAGSVPALLRVDPEQTPGDEEIVSEDEPFVDPNRVVVQENGTVYFVADRGPEPEVCELHAGAIIKVAGGTASVLSPPAGKQNYLVEPVALAIDRDGLLVVLNREVGVEDLADRAPLVRINPDDGFQNPLPLPVATITNIIDPVDLAIDDNGDILVADQGDPDEELLPPFIFRIDGVTGALQEKGYGSASFHTLEGIALDVNRELLVTDSGDPSDWRTDPAVIRVDTTAQTTSIVEIGGERWARPNGIALDQITSPPVVADDDGDAVGDSLDNCPDVFNPDQENSDSDELGDECDNCPLTPNGPGLGTCLEGLVGDPCVDDEGCDDVGDDGLCSLAQEDTDNGGLGDGFGDACEDLDGDGVERSDDPLLDDNCPAISNPRICLEGLVDDPCVVDDDCDVVPGDGLGVCAQPDVNGDLIGDPCQPDDPDGDGWPSDGSPGDDNCPNTANADQANFDGDSFGDACEDLDGDGVQRSDDPLLDDNCPGIPNPRTCLEGLVGNSCVDDEDCDVGGGDGVCSQEDTDGDGIGDACEDLDGDGVELPEDNCPDVFNSDQEDTDDDGVGDACNDADDSDGDDWADALDSCPGISNPRICLKGNVGATCQIDDDCDMESVEGMCSLNQPDVNGDLIGDACQPCDSDADGWPDDEDNCREVGNSDKVDSNDDGIGNMCDADYDNNGVVGAGDFIALSRAWGVTTSDDPRYDPDLDANSDGAIGATEFILLSQYWGQPPGPGLPGCDGTTSPCTGR